MIHSAHAVSAPLWPRDASNDPSPKLSTVCSINTLDSAGNPIPTNFGRNGTETMDILHAISPSFALSGFVVGLLVGLTGVGGGSLMTPLLVLIFSVQATTAVGTDLLYAAITKTFGTVVHHRRKTIDWRVTRRLLYAAITKTFGTVVHHRRKTIDWRVTRRLACGSIPAAIFTLAILYEFGVRGGASPPLITIVLACALILTAVCVVSHRWLRLVTATRRSEPDPRRVAALTITAGLVLGVLVTLSSVGAGAIGMTALVLLYPRTPIAKLVGSDIAHAVPLTLIAGTGHWLLGSVNWLLLSSLLIGSLPGIYVGAILQHAFPIESCARSSQGR